MKLLFTVLLLLFSTSFAISQTLWSRTKLNTDAGDKYGIILSDGSWLIEPNYDNIRVLTKSNPNQKFYFLVEQTGKFGLIDSLGEMILPISFDIIKLSNSFIWVNIEGKVGAYSFSGKKMLDTNYEQVITASYGNYIRLSPQGEYIGFGHEGHFGLVDTSGNVIVPPNYDYIEQKSGFYLVKKNGVSSLYNRFGKKLDIPQFDEFRGDHSQPATYGYLTSKSNGKWGVIDSLGNIVIEPIYSDVYLSRNCIYLNSHGKRGVALLSGQIILEPIYDQLKPDKTLKFFRYSLNKKWGLYSILGKSILPVEYDEIRFSHRYIKILKDGKQGVINYDGQILLEAECDEIIDRQSHDHRYSLLVYKKNDKFGAISLNNKEIAIPKYDTIIFRYQLVLAELNGQFSCFNYDGTQIYLSVEEIKQYRNLLFYRENGLWAAVDRTGIKVVEPLYSEIGSSHYSSLIVAKKGNKWGYISDEGEVAIPFMYDSAEDFNDWTAHVSKDGESFQIDEENNRIKPTKENKLPNHSFWLSTDGEPGNGTGDFPVRIPSPPIDRGINQFKHLPKLDPFWEDDMVGLKRQGKIIFPAEYEQIIISEQEIILTQKDKKWGAFDLSGKLLLEIKYADLTSFFVIGRELSRYTEKQCLVYSNLSTEPKFIMSPENLKTSWPFFYEQLYDRQAAQKGFYSDLHQPPRFPGGFPARSKFIKSAIKYPRKGRKLKTITIVYAKCIFETDGEISSIQVDDPAIPSYFANEAKRIIRLMPNFEAGQTSHKKVRSQMIVPILFDPADRKRTKKTN